MPSTKTALVTGANRGIGKAVAKGLLQKDYTVIVTARDALKGKQATEELKTFGNAIFQQLDVAGSNSIQKAVQAIEEQFGQLDVLVNNAGINYDTHQNVHNADLDEVRTTFETNTFAVWDCIQQFLPLLKKSKAARIVNVSSGAGSWERQNGQTPAYSLSKLALNGLTRSFANYLRSDDILVNAVCPGWVRTDMGGSGANKSPEEGADTIVWAASDPDFKVNGQFFRDRRQIEW
ncbi:MAG: SDR family oxidoreductase [Bacteroidota bacterium]